MIYPYILILIISLVLGSESISAAKPSSLDSLLQEHAFKALKWPKTKTGTVYEGSVPTKLAGMKVSALMLRRDSLKWRGYGYYNEFLIPSGVTEEPHVTRLVLVYQNIGNWSSFYYPLPGYIYLTPVLGILAYDAMNMCCAKTKPELQVHALESAIHIRFSNVQAAPEGSLIKCVYFNHSNVEFGNVTNGNVCSTGKQGHFAIVAELKIAPPDDQMFSGKMWKTISLGFLIFAVLAILFVVAQTYLLVERRVLVMGDAAAIIEPLLGADIVQTEVPASSEEAPVRRLPENDYAIRPLPENDYESLRTMQQF